MTVTHFRKVSNLSRLLTRRHLGVRGSFEEEAHIRCNFHQFCSSSGRVNLILSAYISSSPKLGFSKAGTSKPSSWSDLSQIRLIQAWGPENWVDLGHIPAAFPLALTVRFHHEASTVLSWFMLQFLYRARSPYLSLSSVGRVIPSLQSYQQYLSYAGERI